MEAMMEAIGEAVNDNKTASNGTVETSEHGGALHAGLNELVQEAVQGTESAEIEMKNDEQQEIVGELAIMEEVSPYNANVESQVVIESNAPVEQYIEETQQLDGQVIDEQMHELQQDGQEIQQEVHEMQQEGDVIQEVTEIVQEQEESGIQEEDTIHEELAEMHEETVEHSENVETLQIEETSAHSTDAENETETEQEQVIEEEMILEETTGEYVLASSIVRHEEEEVPVKRPKVDKKQKQSKADLQTGQKIIVMTKDEKGNPQEVLLTTTTTTDKNGVIIQHVVDESGEIYLLETADSNDEAEEEVVQEPEDVPKRKTRGSTKKLQIPNHVLGRNIINPVEDTFRNGKPPPKPRLGVKIPYRNLTSQIVSKQEIADEILERSRRFSNNMFAQKLTQNLAKKLQPKEKAAPKPRGRPPLNRLSKKVAEKIDNSDLLAILEGDDGNVDTPPAKDSMTTEMEREIALKQLRELPEDPPVVKKDDKKDKKVKGTEEAVKSHFTGSTPLKTYGRKRKTSEDVLQQITLKPIIPKQENPTSNSNNSPQSPRASTKTTASSTPDANYMTKSSRIIKKKVIWDPDASTPKKGSKPEPPKDSTSKEAKKDVRETKKDAKDKEKEKDANQEEKSETSQKKSETVKKTPESPKKPRGRPPKEVEESEPEEDQVEEDKPAEKPSTPVKIKRRLGEVSKLLMDEGAINMLYAIKNEDGTSSRRPKSLQSKADELLNDLNDMTSNNSDKASPKALRKKEGSATPTPNTNKSPKKIMCPPTPSPISRQKSKDSNRSSVHSPPPSPGPAFSGVESRIIRRHSSSSYSSMGEEDEEERRVKKIERGRRRALQSSSVSTNNKKIKVDTKPSQAAKSKNDNFEKLVEIKLNASDKYNKYKTFSVNSLNKLVQIDLGGSQEDDSVYLTNELMEEVTSLLKELEDDKGVNVVLITSDGPVYCNGINFQSLIHPKEATRKTAAKKLATQVKDFLLGLAKFPKVLVAGIHGDSMGIGVTMLPLFDMIIANEDATFTIPNAKLGCIAEGASLLLLPHLSRNVLVNELLYSSQTLTAEEALKLGLVTKILPKNSYSKELLAAVKSVSDKSAQFMVSTKKQLRKNMIPDITTSLTEETENLIEQWTSEECQKNFAEYFNID